MWRHLLGCALLAGLLSSGCAAISAMSLAVDAITGGVGIYQRYEDRQEQKDQTQAIKDLRAAVEASTAEMVRLRALMERSGSQPKTEP